MSKREGEYFISKTSFCIKNSNFKSSSEKKKWLSYKENRILESYGKYEKICEEKKKKGKEV